MAKSRHLFTSCVWARRTLGVLCEGRCQKLVMFSLGALLHGAPSRYFVRVELKNPPCFYKVYSAGWLPGLVAWAGMLSSSLDWLAVGCNWAGRTLSALRKGRCQKHIIFWLGAAKGTRATYALG